MKGKIKIVLLTIIALTFSGCTYLDTDSATFQVQIPVSARAADISSDAAASEINSFSQYVYLYFYSDSNPKYLYQGGEDLT